MSGSMKRAIQIFSFISFALLITLPIVQLNAEFGLAFWFILCFGLIEWVNNTKLNPSISKKDILIVGILFIPLAIGSCLSDQKIIFAAGPFYVTGTAISANDIVNDSTLYRGGIICTYTGQDSIPSKIAYFKNSELIWAYALDTGDDDFNLGEFGITKIEPGLFRDKFNFFSGGTMEPGWFYYSKFTSIHKYYLMEF